VKVNVLMPVYNGAEKLGRTVASVLEQTWSDFSLVIVDDCSTDHTLNMIKAFAEKDQRIKLVQSEFNQGIVGALNKGLMHLDDDCEYVARIDCGDICARERLAKQVEYLERHPEVSLIGTEFEMFSESGELPEGILRFQRFSNGLHHHGEIKDNFTVMAPFAHPTLMFRRSFFVENGLYSDAYDAAEDYEIVGRAISRSCQVSKIPEVLVRCEFTPNQGISQVKRIKQVKSALRVKLDFMYSNYVTGPQHFFIWGSKDFAGYLEEELKNEKYQARVKAFTDFDESVWSQVKNGLPIIPPEIMIRSMEKGDRVITMWNIGREEIVKYLDGHGLQRNVNYFVFS